MFRLSLNPVADSYLLVIAVAVVLAALLALVPGRGRTRGWRRWALVLLRLGVILLLTAAMLRPTLIYTRLKKQSATLVLLADQSRSMGVPDAVGGKTRWEALKESVADAAGPLKQLAEDFEVKVYTFGAEAQAVDLKKDGELPLPKEPLGKQTAIGAVLEDVLRAEAGKRLLGVILLSDGAQRALAPRDEPPQTAAARLKYLGYRLFTFPFGQSRGLGQAQDVAVRDLRVNPTVFVKNELAIRAEVRVDGYVNREIPVRVLFETSPGKMEVVAEKKITVEADNQLLPVEFTYAPQIPGEFKITIQAENQPGELVTTNNRLSTFVDVLKGGLNVLYLEGVLRVETKFIRRALKDSKNINIDYLRIDPRDPQSRPGNFDECFRPGKYDVFLLGDLDSTAFQDGELKDLAECVNRGAGLMMFGGLHSFGAGGYYDTPLAKVLPVGMDRFDRQNFGEPIRSDLHWPGPVKMHLTPLGEKHFALRLASGLAENAALWEKLPPLLGANRFHDLARGALVLAATDDNQPLLVAQQYGEGRVLAFAGDSTWQWQMQGYGRAFKRFWRQIILWLAKKDQAQEEGVWIKLDPRRYAPTERVEFSTGARGADGEPAKDAQFQAEVVLPDGGRRPLALIRQEDRMIGSLHDTQAAGDYAIEVKALEKGQELGSARARFLVFQQDLELDNAAADADTLKSLAAMTGGQTLAPEELGDLIARLAAETSQLEIQQETKKTLWDSWPFFLTLVGLLSVEWFLRKHWGLV